MLVACIICVEQKELPFLNVVTIPLIVGGGWHCSNKIIEGPSQFTHMPRYVKEIPKSSTNTGAYASRPLLNALLPED